MDSYCMAGFNKGVEVRTGKSHIMKFCKVVFDLTQNLNFVEPTPEQIGTTTMHFPEVSDENTLNRKALTSFVMQDKA